MPHRDLNPTEARVLLDSDEGWTFVDVRTQEEFDMGHPDGAWHIPIGFRDAATGQMVPNPDFLAVIKKHFAPDAKLVFG